MLFEKDKLRKIALKVAREKHNQILQRFHPHELETELNRRIKVLRHGHDHLGRLLRRVVEAHNSVFGHLGAGLLGDDENVVCA